MTNMFLRNGKPAASSSEQTAEVKLAVLLTSLGRRLALLRRCHEELSRCHADLGEQLLRLLNERKK